MTQVKMDNIYKSVCTKFSSTNNIVIIRKRSTEAAADLDTDILDWVYIDGDHTYRGAKVDLNAYSSKIKLGGYLCGDDYTTGGWWKGGVKKAVDEFLKENNGKFQLVQIKNYQYILKRTN